MLLCSAGFVSHLTDDSPAATTNVDDKEVKAWCLNDDHVIASIWLNVDLSICSCLEDHTTSKEMWDYLKGHYQQSSSALRYSIH
jgi:hypothetical protein